MPIDPYGRRSADQISVQVQRLAAAKLVIIERSHTKAELLQFFCATKWGFDVVAVEQTCADGLVAVKRTEPNVILAGLQNLETDAVDLLRGLRRAAPSAKIVGLISQCNEFIVHAVATSDCHGLIYDADESLSELGHAIERVRSGLRSVSARTSGISALNLTVGQRAGSTSTATAITGFSGAVAGWAVSSGVVNPLAFAAALSDTGSKNKVKILTAPTIVTTHNREAEIIVGQSQPIITGTVSTPISSGTTTSFATSDQVTYKDIAIDLKLTPLIGDDGLIQIKIDQRVDDILGNVVIDGNSQPIIGRREATSFINVNDGQMVVLGGMQRTVLTNDRTKMGLLTEIPVISQIFGNRSDETDRTELLLFIRPHVIKPQDDTPDAIRSVNTISSKKQVNEYLKQENEPMSPKDPKS
jgi:DNA-binding NarL/FixJ family response regulator